MDLFAAEIGMDPAEVRRRNLHPARRVPVHAPTGGATYDSGDYAEALDRVLDAAGYAELRAEQAARRERGDAVQLGIGARRVTSRSPAAGRAALAEDATVEVHPDGTVTVLTGTSPHGQGHATAWAMLASEQLGIPVEMITVKHGDTDLVPRGGGTMGSRSLQTGGVAVHQAAVELVELARQRAADVLEAARRRPRGGRAARCGCAARSAAVALGRLAEPEPLRTCTATFTAPGADVPVRRAPGRRRGRRRDRQGGASTGSSPSTTPGRCSTRCSPRASGTAASPRASPRRCSRRSCSTPTATR